jgi:hypothetical protein
MQPEPELIPPQLDRKTVYNFDGSLTQMQALEVLQRQFFAAIHSFVRDERRSLQLIVRPVTFDLSETVIRISPGRHGQKQAHIKQMRSPYGDAKGFTGSAQGVGILWQAILSVSNGGTLLVESRSFERVRIQRHRHLLQLMAWCMR